MEYRNRPFEHFLEHFRAQHVCRLTDGTYGSTVQEDQAVRETCGDVEVMGDHDTTEPLIANELCGELEYFHFVTYIETRRGLIEYQRAWRLGKRPSNAYALPLTARQSRDPSVTEIHHVTLSHCIFDRIAVGSRQATDGANMGKAPKRHCLVHAQRKRGFFPLRDDANVSCKFSA